MAPQRRATDHLSQPAVPGEVVEAPVFIRVKPSWIEKALFIAVLTQILLAGLFLLGGSQPVRDLLDMQRHNRFLHCMTLEADNPELHMQAKMAGYCP